MIQLCLPPPKNMLLVSSIPNIASSMCLRVYFALCLAQAAILQTAQKDKEAAERAATKKISLLEKHAAGKLSSNTAAFMRLHIDLASCSAQAAISQTAVQKDKEAAEKAATKCISLLRVQMDDGTSAIPPFWGLTAHKIRHQRSRSASGQKGSWQGISRAYRHCRMNINNMVIQCIAFDVICTCILLALCMCMFL